ncbi:hypothetical protein L226DRAFT_147238 [Lentinus tigrinus ALCF2SS1-7]|uniref:uncharacterized protein n=1 Tax=Lentinus tigrinus ALCF2SS1-7 TaxID=1328758 RepID=UPI0011662141|nr:hypothetical protein L226DRAFT_147238 [Lentinus tigrinus ALCF2SS1-7]
MQRQHVNRLPAGALAASTAETASAQLMMDGPTTAASDHSVSRRRARPPSMFAFYCAQSPTPAYLDWPPRPVFLSPPSSVS